MIEPFDATVAADVTLFKPKRKRTITYGQGYDLHAVLLEMLRFVYDHAHKKSQITPDVYKQLEDLFNRVSTREYYVRHQNPYAFKAAVLEAIDAIFLEQQRHLRPW